MIIFTGFEVTSGDKESKMGFGEGRGAQSLKVVNSLNRSFYFK